MLLSNQTINSDQSASLSENSKEAIKQLSNGKLTFMIKKNDGYFKEKDEVEKLKRDLTAVGIAAGGREEAGRAGMEMMGRMMPQPTQPPNFFPNQPMFQQARIYPQPHGEMRQGQMIIGSQVEPAMLAPPPIIASAPQENTGQAAQEIG